MKLLGLFFIIFFVSSHCLAQEANDEAVFKEKLLQWVNSVNAFQAQDTPENGEKMNGALRALRKFTLDFPNSRFADDAEFIRYNSTEVSFETWERFATKYPNAKIEDFTKQELRKLTGFFASFGDDCNVPYEFMSLYVREREAWSSEDYREAEMRLSEFIQKIDFYYPQLKVVLLRGPYLRLMEIYKGKNQKNEYNRMKEKFIGLFPAEKAQAENIWP